MLTWLSVGVVWASPAVGRPGRLAITPIQARIVLTRATRAARMVKEWPAIVARHNGRSLRRLAHPHSCGVAISQLTLKVRERCYSVVKFLGNYWPTSRGYPTPSILATWAIANPNRAIPPGAHGWRRPPR